MDDLISENDLNCALESMYFGFRSLIAEPDAQLKNLGMSRVHHRILYFIGRNPDCSIGELLEKLMATKQYINRPLRWLIEQDFVHATPDTHDRRIKRLKLSSKGAALEDALSGIQRDHFAKVFDQAGPEAQAGWYEVMRLLSEVDHAAETQ